MPDKKLESTGITLDGTPIALRPLLPEDEPALQDLFAHISREDVRLRFFTPMRELKHALAARLSHLDYSREMALVAQHDGMTLGVARYSADPDRRSAAFAVAVSRLAWAWRWATVDDSTDRGHSNAATVNRSGRCCTRTSRC